MNVPLNIESIRRDTPGCENMVHLNNAGSSLPPQSVTQSMIDHLKLESQMGGYEAFDAAQEKCERTYGAIAELIHAKPHEIAFMENATRAWSMAFYGISFNAGDRILTAHAEYASNYIAYLQVGKRTGVKIDVIPDDEYGQVCLKSLENMMDDRVKLIAITHVPTNGGLVNPAAEIGKIAKDAGVLYLLDACQSVGQMPIDVKSIGCHILSATGRKYLRGPRGTGFLYVDEGILEKIEPPFLDLHSAEWDSMNTYKIRGDAKRFETWETNYAAKFGLGVAVDYANNLGLEAIWGRVHGLGNYLRKKLGNIPGVTLHDKGKEKCGIATFSLANKSAKDVQKHLRYQKINTSVSSIQYARLDMEPRGLENIVRASVHYYNTEEELNSLCEALGLMA